jgi:hypothetical protein
MSIGDNSEPFSEIYSRQNHVLRTLYIGYKMMFIGDYRDQKSGRFESRKRRYDEKICPKVSQFRVYLR